MFLKHVYRSFKRQWFKLVLIGLIMTLSSLVYTMIGLAVNAIQEGAEPFFEEYRQEDFTIMTTAHMTEFEQVFHQHVCSDDLIFLDRLYTENKDCYEAVLAGRLALLEDGASNAEFEIRRMKDTFINHEDENHRIRIIKDGQAINLSLIEYGDKPNAPNEIAITQNYAKHNDLSIGDMLRIQNNDYKIVGFVLFPDYNLPITDNLYLFDTMHQTLALLTDDDYQNLNTPELHYISGVFTEEKEDLNQRLIDEHEEITAFITYIVMTENNTRSGAIYMEIEGGQATGVFFSVLIAFIGIIIIGIMIHKMIEREKSAIGMFKALGITRLEIIWPYLFVMFFYTLFFLWIGFFIGVWLAVPVRDVFLNFYLLPKVDIAIQTTDLILAILLPLSLIMTLIYYRLFKLVRVPAVKLLHPSVKTPRVFALQKIKRLFKRFNIMHRIQVGVLIRQWVKALTYGLGIFLAFYLIFLSLGMRGLFKNTLEDYYTNTNFESIVYCQDMAACDTEGKDKVIEIQAMINERSVSVIALENDNVTHPLKTRRGEDLLHRLEDGIIISASLKDMSGISLGDTVTISIGQADIDLEVVGIADIHLGPYAFLDRHLIAQTVFSQESYFNALYSEDKLLAQEAGLVVHVDDILSQITHTEDIMDTMILAMLIIALFMAVVVIVLLTSLSIEEQAFEMSVFSVLGYHNRDIGKMLLGGYFKLNVVIFIISIPLVMISFTVLRIFMARSLDYYIPLRLSALDILYTGAIAAAIYFVSSLYTKRRLKRYVLQEALKKYQV